MSDPSELSGVDPFGLMDAESERLAEFFAQLDADGWHQSTRCAGWRRREMVAHLAGGEVYNLACLNGTLEELFRQAADAGVSGVDEFNEWQVSLREDREASDVLSEWIPMNAEVRRRMRELGRDAEMQTSVGPYPVGLQAFHLASEYATHGDDMGIPVGAEEAGPRTRWRARFSRFAVREAGKPAEIEVRDGTNVIRAHGKETELDDSDLVAVVSARLPDGHRLPTEFREALRALA